MAFWQTSRLALLLCTYVLTNITRATYGQDVIGANYILHDLPSSLAGPLCIDYIYYEDRTRTCTVTSAMTTVSSEIPPTTCVTTSKTQIRSGSTRNLGTLSSNPLETFQDINHLDPAVGLHAV